MLKIVSNLSRNLVKSNHQQQNFAVVCLRNFAASAKQKEKPRDEKPRDEEDDSQQPTGKGEQKIHHGQLFEKSQKETMKEKDDFEYDPFITSFEYHNMSEEEKRKYKEVEEMDPIKKFVLFNKIAVKNLIKFIKTEILLTGYMESGKNVYDQDIDCVWEFKNKKDIKRWLVACDSDMEQGFSTVKLSTNQQNRLVFSGYLDCETLPKDGIVEFTGYSHLSSPHKKTGFGLEDYYDWQLFNHLLIRFRGDGRVYRIMLKSCSMQGAQTDSFYEYFLYTRGGPYWQTAKIPFSKFVLCYQGRIQDKPKPLMSDKIQAFSITVNKYTGPYKLEISHIGVQIDEKSSHITEYEGYFYPELAV